MKKIFTVCCLAGLLQFNSNAENANKSDLVISAQNTFSHLTDGTTLGFDPSASNSFDSKYDTLKVAGNPASPSVYTLNSGQMMSTNILASVTSNSIVRLGLKPGSTGSFALSFSGVSSFDPTTYITLRDVLTNTTHDVRSGDYNFLADSAENPNRFYLEFSPPAVISATASCDNQGIINVTQPGTANWNYTLSGNNTTASGVLNANNSITTTVPAGVYTLTLTDNNNYTAVKTITVTGGVATPIAGITVPSSTVAVETQVDFTSTAQNVDFYSWDFGDGTPSTGVNNPTHTYTSPGTYEVNLTVMSGPGCMTSASKTITVTGTTTGIMETGTGNVNVWSHGNSVYVDLTHSGEANAEIRIYDALGRELSNDKFSSNSVFQKQLSTINTADIIVSVISGGKTTTHKLMISNGK